MFQFNSPGFCALPAGDRTRLTASGIPQYSAAVSLNPDTPFHLARGGNRAGPYPASVVRQMLERGELAPTDLAWADGMEAWQPIAEVAGLAPAAPPPGGRPLDRAREPAFPDAAAPELARRVSRFAAAFIDGVLLMIPVALIIYLIDGAAAFEPETEPSDTAIFSAMGYLIALGITQVVLLSLRGQTIGKIICRIRIVLASSGAPAGFLNAVVLRGFLASLPTGIPILGLLYYLIDICFIFGAERRCLHDYIGGTRVVIAD